MNHRRRSLLLAFVLAGCATAPSAVHGDDLFAAGTLAARCMCAPYDPANHRDTCKVFHHLYAPDGRVVTKGLGGEFEHHRGLFFGFHQVQCGDRKFDFWHCHKGETQRFAGYLAPAVLGLGDGWQVAAIDWCDDHGAPIVREHRALRARPLDAATTVFDVVCELRAADLAVQLGGDPQHSGHQFRALDAFSAKDAPKVTYLRPSTAVAHPDDIWTDCDWTAALLPCADGPVTVLRCEQAGNPQPVRWSTRPYGRFGATFAHRLEPRRPLRVAYTYAVHVGALDEAQCAALALALAARPQ